MTRGETYVMTHTLFENMFYLDIMSANEMVEASYIMLMAL